MIDPYPNIRSQNPPAFLQRIYGNPRALLAAATDRLDAAPLINLEPVAKCFPRWEDLFGADDGVLERAISLGLRPCGSASEIKLRFIATVKRLLIFEDLDAVTAVIRQRIKEVVADFPRTLTDLEEGGGGRDVIDPFIVALAYRLLSNDSLKELLRHLVAHKCLMKLEDLIGHLHEEVLGRAAGKQRVAEPEGTVGSDGKKNKESWHPTLNPFPGADARLDDREFYQIKNKTGSAKGSDGEKLGRQFKQLGEKYPGSKRFYVSMIGKSLAGHRSMGAFLRTDPGAEVLVGLAAFQQLGAHRDSPNIVLDLVLQEFEEVKSELHYEFDSIVDAMLADWQRKHGTNDPAHRLLHDMITPAHPEDQQSGSYQSRRERRRSAEAGRPQ